MKSAENISSNFKFQNLLKNYFFLIKIKGACKMKNVKWMDLFQSNSLCQI